MGRMKVKMKRDFEETVAGFDIDAIRADFPILSERVHGEKPLVYLDNAATTQKPACVLTAIEKYYRTANSNVHRALHELAARATEGYEGARASVARFIGAPTPESIVFTRGTTESINLVAHGWGRGNIGRGDEILLTEMEHHSNLVPWQMLARAVGAELRFVPMLDDGTLDLDAYAKLLGPRTKLVAVTQMSNVLGTINPIKSMVAQARAQGALFLVDAAQSVPHMAVDVQDLDCDFLAFSGHKMCAPTGIGALYIRPSVVDRLEPFMGGGEMILKVQLEESTWAEPPHRFEAGTPNIAGAFGLAAAIDYLESVGMDRIRDHEQALTAYALDRLREVPGLTLFGTARERGGAISFALGDVHPHDVAQFVDREGVAIRAGHHCAQPLMRRLGVHATSRASLYLYNTEAEVDALVAALRKTLEFFGDDT